VRIDVRLFAGLRERAGSDLISLDLSDGALVRDALTELRWLMGESSVVMAVNREYATPELALSPGDELALIPPVSGGAPDRTLHARMRDAPLEPGAITARVSDPRAGAVVTFLGVTREVPALEYEAYMEMAERKLLTIVAAAAERHDLCSAAAEHRVGTVRLSEPSVVVAASAPHRDAAFAGAREIIDALKAQAPIWKREAGEWVAGVSPSAETM
jgi:molybdopterin synthase catalytic subunit/molybdopterin converting factor small subunit